MPAAAFPPQELARLADLHDHGLLDGPRDPTLDGLAALAAESLRVPVAMLNLVDADRQWHHAACGFADREMPRSHSFCAHALLEPGPLLVEDAREDPRFADNPLVTREPRVRAYAGAPIHSEVGRQLGSFCVIGFEPRAWTPAEVRRLEAFAHQAAGVLALHRRLAEARRRAERDPATGLLHAEAFEEAVDRSLAGGSGAVVASLRLRGADAAAGEAGLEATLVREAAARLTAALEAGLAGVPGVPEGADRRLATLGGAAFGVLLGGVPDPAAAAAGLAAAVEAALRPGFESGGRRFRLDAATGTACAAPARRGAHADAAARGADLLARATLARREAERAGGCARVAAEAFSVPMLRRAREASEMEAALREAVAEGAVTPALQPVIDLQSSRLVGFEALARWVSPAGPVSPAVFVPLAERLGLADGLFGCVAGPALRFLQGLGSEGGAGGGGEPPFLSLNLSKLQLRDPGLVGRVDALVRGAGLTPGRVHLELTESDVAESASALATMHRLEEAGFELMLDDFGTGTSTLASLHAYPVSWLKIDRGFTAAAARGWRVAVVADAVAELARKLKLKTVAEGIETAEELPMFQAMGFDLGQGYHFARPMPPAAAAAWVRDELVGGRWAGSAERAKAA